MPMQAAMPQMNAPNYGSTSTNQTSNFRMPGFDAPSEGSKDLRGDLNGDECLTIDVDDIVISAVWHERSCECVISTVTLSGDGTGSATSIGCLENISLFVTESVLKLQQRTAAEELSKETSDASKKTSASTNKKKKKDSSLACGKGGITLILPSCTNQSSLRSAAASVTLSGLSVKNIFGRGIATVCGMLARSAGKGPNPGPTNNLLALLDANKKSGKVLEKDPVVLHVYFRNHGSGDTSSGSVSIDAALIVLESGNGVRNNLCYERLSTLAVAEGQCDGTKGGIENILRVVLGKLITAAHIDEVRYF